MELLESNTVTNNITGNQSTTAATTPSGIVLSDEQLYIIIGSLSGTLIVLTAILLIICCARKKQKRVLSASHIEGGAPDVRSLRPVAAVAPIAAVSRDLRAHIEDYVDMNENGIPKQRAPSKPVVDNHIASGSYAETDNRGVNTPIPRPAPRTSINSNSSNHDADDYENAPGIIYENHKPALITQQIRRPVPAPVSPPEEKEPPLMPRKRSTESVDSDRSNLFRRGTKAYHLYGNALHDYEISDRDLTLTTKVGKGHFGTVYAGVAARLPHSTKTRVPVAVKTMKVSASDADKQEFLYEYQIMKLTNTLNHENITKLLASVTKTQPCRIVLELCTNGNLRNFLRGTRSQDTYYNLHGNSNSLSERQLLQFAIDIANGMEGIADLQLLHRDLATRNILLDANMRCKIADFGFAKDILNKPEYKSKSVFHRARPVRWLPPESIFYFKHNIMSDVWSYGIVLWEIVTLGNLPYPNMKVREVSIIFRFLLKKYYWIISFSTQIRKLTLYQDNQFAVKMYILFL